MNHVIDRVRWARSSIFDQMGNIGSEVGRALKAERQGNPDDRDAAVRRGLDLFDATVEHLVALRSVRTKEVLRARDQFLTQLYGDPASSPASLELYFTQFAIAARRHR